jgi:hypothetical protein
LDAINDEENVPERGSEEEKVSKDLKDLDFKKMGMKNEKKEGKEEKEEGIIDEESSSKENKS